MRRVAWALGIVGIALVLGFAVRTWLIGDVDPRGLVLGVAGAVALLLYAGLDRDEPTDALTSPAARHGTTATALVAVTAIVASLAYVVVRGHDAVLDLTGHRVHTLSTHTDAVLRGLDRDVDVLGFFPRGSTLQGSFDDLVRRYVDASPRLRVRWIDPLREPALARAHEVDVEAGEVVLVSGARSEHLVGRFDEDALTDAIVRVVSERDHVVCWSEGHGEVDPDDARASDGYGAAVLALEGEDFQVVPARLLTGSLDPSCEIVVVARPTIDLLPFERRILLDFVAAGGRALVLLDPGSAPGLARSLRALGVAVGDDVVVDADPSRRPAGIEDPSVLLIDPREGGGHPIAAALQGAVVLALARSVGTVDHTPGVAAHVLLRASRQSRAEPEFPGAGVAAAVDVPVAAVAEVTDADALALPAAAPAAVEPDEVRDAVVRIVRAYRGEPGDVPLDATLSGLGLDAGQARGIGQALGSSFGIDVEPGARTTIAALVDRAVAASEARLPAGAAAATALPRRDGGAIVVVGDAGFASNRGVDVGANLDLFLDALTWLASEEARLGANPEDVGDQLPITASGEAIVSLIALGLAPGAALLLAGRAVWRRRNG